MEEEMFKQFLKQNPESKEILFQFLMTQYDCFLITEKSYRKQKYFFESLYDDAFDSAFFDEN